MASRRYMNRETLEFARRILAGDSQIQAYRVSHPNARSSKTSMAVRACNMAKTKHVQEYLSKMEEKVNRELATEAVITKREALEFLGDVINDTLPDSKENPVKLKDRLAAAQTASELLGWKKDLGASQAVTFHLHMDGEKKEPSPVPDQ